MVCRKQPELVLQSPMALHSAMETLCFRSVLCLAVEVNMNIGQRAAIAAREPWSVHDAVLGEMRLDANHSRTERLDHATEFFPKR